MLADSVRLASSTAISAELCQILPVLVADQLAVTATEYVGELTEDADQVVAQSARNGQERNISDRSVRLAILSMAVAMEMAFDHRQVREVGLSGLVHDWGMYRLPERMRDPDEPFSCEDWLLYMTHPRLTLDLLELVRNVSAAVRVASFHVHEQADGSGFPQGLRRERIHPYARILNVVDAYLSLTSRVRGRPALIPYDAMSYLLHHTRTGEFDRKVVAAFLQVFSLFPIGSYVRLSDGTQAKVLRRNREFYMEPLVQRVTSSRTVRIDPAHGEETIVDLAANGLRIEAPLPTPNRREMRLDPELMSVVRWEGPNS